MTLPSFLTSKVLLIAIGVLVALVGVKQVQLSDVRADKALADAAYAVCKSDVATLTQTIASQNLAVEQLGAAAATLQAKANAVALESLKKRQQQRNAGAVVQGAGAEVMNQWLKNTFSQ